MIFFAGRYSHKALLVLDILTFQTGTSNIGIAAEPQPVQSEPYYRALYNLFGIFEHRRPSISDLDDIIRLIKLADKYDSLPPISRAVRLHLIEADGQPLSLYQDIATDPVKYLYVGEMVRSSTIVKEAATHVIGTWSRSSEECQSILSNTLFDTLVRKYHELKAKKEAANRRLLSLEMVLSEFPDQNHHQTSSNRSFHILARVRNGISQAFSRCYAQPDYEKLEGKMYREVAQSADIAIVRSYQGTKGFNDKDQPKLFKNACLSVKAGIIMAIGDLAETCLQWRSLPDHITCMRLEDSDLPWSDDWE